MFREGDFATSFQNTPTLVGDTLYVCSPRNSLIALDPETGAEKWVYEAKINPEGIYIQTCRGVAHWQEPSPVAGRPCQERVYMGTLDARMIGLDAKTGKLWRDAIRVAAHREAEDGRKEIEHIAEKLVQLAKEGDVSAIKELGDRIDGKAVQAIAGDDDNPLTFVQKIEIVAAGGKRKG